MGDAESATAATIPKPEREAVSIFGRSYSLRGSLIALLAVALLPAGGLAIGKAINTVREARALRDAALIAQFESFVDDQQALFLRARNLVRYARDDIALVIDDPAQCNAVAERIAEADSRFHAAHFTSVDGFVRCGSDGFSEPVYVGDGPAFDGGQMTQDPGASVTVGRVSRIPVLVISEPVFDANETHLGALSISLSIGVVDALAKLTDDDSEARIALIPKQSFFVAPIAEDWGEAGWLPGEPWARNIGPEPIVWIADNAEGEEFVYVAGNVRRSGLVAIAGWPAQRLPSILGAETALSLALPVFTWMFASVIIFFAIKRLVIRNLDQLTDLTRKIRAGDLGARAAFPEGAPVEFVQLGHDFDGMAAGIEERDAKLRRAVNEQRLLLREVYHRVKNNLQLIVSLINLQLRNAPENEDSRLLRQTQDRVQSMALVHQSLYQVGNLSESRLDTVLQQVVDALLSVRGVSPELKNRIATDLDPTPLDADRAVPSALLATEALLNAFKHAQFSSSDAKINIILRSQDDGGFMLEIANDIIAEDEAEIDASATGKKLGSRLMQGFARQLRGHLSQKVENGRFKMVMVAPPPEPSIEKAE